MIKWIYYWQAMDGNANLIEGEQLAIFSFEVKRDLLNRGVIPFIVRRGALLQTGQDDSQTRILFLEQLSAMLSAGLPLDRCIALLQQSHSRSHWCWILKQLADELYQGSAFSQALRRFPKVFPTLCCEVIQVGELTGRLAICCDELAKGQALTDKLRKEVLKALRYPAFILAVALLVIILMLLFVMPQFAQIYSSFNSQLPALTLLFIQLAQWLADHGTTFFLFSGSALICYLYGRKKMVFIRQGEQRLLLVTPVIKQLLQLGFLSRFFAMMALMTQAGIKVDEALEVLITMTDIYTYQSTLRKMSEDIEQGSSLFQASSRHSLFPEMSRQLLLIGEESGELDTLLAKLATYYQEELMRQATGLTKTLEPCFMLILGLIVGSLVIAMYLPVFQLGEVMNY